MIMLRLSLVLMTFFSLSARADNWYERGNGGFLLSCKNQKDRALDLYEIEDRLKGNTLDLTHASDVQERVNYLLSKLQRWNHERAELYGLWSTRFLKGDSEFKSGKDLSPINDVGLGFVPPGCELKQVIFQRPPSGLNQRLYTINSDLWQGLDVINQAAMMVHELIYRELAAPPSSHVTSESARTLNAWLNSVEFDQLTERQYVELLKSLHFVSAEYRGMAILLNVKDSARNVWQDLPFQIDPNYSTLLTFDVSRPLTTPHWTLTPSCTASPSEVLLTAGGAWFDLQEEIDRIGPIGYSEDIIKTCFSFFSVPGKHYFIRAKSWEFLHGKLSKAQGHYDGGKYQEAEISNYRGFNLNSIPNFPVDVTFKLDTNQDIQTIEFVGKSCLSNQSNNTILIWKDSPDNPKVLWNGDDAFDSMVKKLSKCND